MKPWQNKEWCIPSTQNPDFVCAMEDVLEVYKRPYDPDFPLICMDESSKQFIDEIRTPIPVAPNKPEKYEVEIEVNNEKIKEKVRRRRNFFTSNFKLY